MEITQNSIVYPKVVGIWVVFFRNRITSLVLFTILCIYFKIMFVQSVSASVFMICSRTKSDIGRVREIVKTNCFLHE